MASGSHDGDVRLWDALNDSPLAVLEGHWQAVTAVAFSPDGRALLSGSQEGTLRAWELSQ